MIWYHRRGYDGKPTKPVGLPEQARDVVKILDALEIDKAHVVGHSAGSHYVLALATLAPDRLLSATFLDFALIPQVPSGEMFMAAMKPSIEKARAGDFAGAGATMFTAMGLTEELLERALPGSWAAMAQDAPTWFQMEIPAQMKWAPDPAEVGAIEVPLALLSVTGSPPFRETGELLQKWQPNLSMLEISSDNHFFIVTATAETAGVLDRWFESQGRAKESRG